MSCGTELLTYLSSVRQKSWDTEFVMTVIGNYYSRVSKLGRELTSSLARVSRISFLVEGLNMRVVAQSVSGSMQLKSCEFELCGKS